MQKKKRAKTNTKKNPSALPVIRPKVAGIDLGSTEHWVCGRAFEDGSPDVRVFQTTTPQLKKLVDWLLEQGIESVAMESTSVYWIPLYELLEVHGVEVLLVTRDKTTVLESCRRTHKSRAVDAESTRSNERTGSSSCE
jgi:transposase